MKFAGRYERPLAIATLVLLATTLPELTTGNSPAGVLFRPIPLLFFVGTYGIPVLALREWTTRRNLGAPALFVMGLAYGLLNEGLFAKTVFHATDLPIQSFDGAGSIGGVNVPWTLYICCWHALASVVLPVALTHSIFPRQSWANWLPRGLATVLAAPVLVLGSLTFLAPLADHEGGRIELAVLLAAMTAIVVVARRVRGAWTGGPDRRIAATLAGAALLAVEFVAVLTAGARPGLIVFAVVLAAALAGTIWTLRRFQLSRLPALAYLGVGFYLATATLAAAAGTGDGLTVAVVLTILGAAAWGVHQANRVTLAVPVGVPG